MNSYTVRFFIAIGIGCAAAFLNYLWMQQNVPTTQEFTIIKNDIDKGDNVAADALDGISLPNVGKNYSRFFVPYGDRFALIDRPASRDFKAGEIVRNSDFTELDYLPDVDVLGPFRLLSIGNQLAGSRTPVSQSYGSQIPITFIVKAPKRDGVHEFDSPTRRLLQLINHENSGAFRSESGRSDRRLMHVIA